MTREEELRKARERMQKRYEDRNSSGASSRPNILDFEKIGGYKKELFYKLKEGQNNLDILPYKIKTKNHPDVRSGKANIGDIDYVLSVFVHKNVGAKKGTYVCPQRMYGLPCAICDEREERYKDPKENKKELGKMYPQERVLYNVLDLDSKGEPTIQLLDMTFKDFEKPLRQAAGINDGVTIFYDHEIGKSIRILAENDPFPDPNIPGKTISYIKPSRIDFVDRQKPYQANITDFTYSLDEMLIVLTSEELHKVHYGQDQVEDVPTETQKPVPTAQKPVTPASNNPFAGRGKPLVTPETPTPAPVDQPVRADRLRQRPNKTEAQCPYNHEWGKENGAHPECNSCEDSVWKACCAEYDKLGG